LDRRIGAVLDALGTVIFGKEQVLRRAVCCLLARGHMLIEDVPGVGKTTMAHALARLVGLGFRRIQFTSDLLPSDVIGANIYSREREAFTFHPGPLFTQVVLADEINRASPKTQSALLEAMEEGRVTVEGTSHPLPEPFFVIATQNPTEQFGTFPLPESQIDRFLMCVELGTPDREAERRLLTEPPRQSIVQTLSPALEPGALVALQQEAERVHVADAIVDYLLELLAHTRTARGRGLSPRAGLSLQAAARAWALMEGRDHVLPEDVQAVAPMVIRHRLGDHATGDAAVRELLQSVPVR
jgi:MoxR-like ATPase